MKTNIVVIIAVLALAAGFGGGYYFRNYQTAKSRGNFANGQFQRVNGIRTGSQNGAGIAGSRVTGSIISQDDKSITVKMSDGSTKIILLSETTTYSNTITAAKSDFKIGMEVAVFGTGNSDGSVSASNVQINPEFLRPTPTPASK